MQRIRERRIFSFLGKWLIWVIHPYIWLGFGVYLSHTKKKTYFQHSFSWFLAGLPCTTPIGLVATVWLRGAEITLSSILTMINEWKTFIWSQAHQCHDLVSLSPIFFCFDTTAPCEIFPACHPSYLYRCAFVLLLKPFPYWKEAMGLPPPQQTRPSSRTFFISWKPQECWLFLSFTHKNQESHKYDISEF